MTHWVDASLNLNSSSSLLIICCGIRAHSSVAVSPQARMNSSPKDIPNVLNTGQIRRHGGPVHSVHIVNTKKVVDDTSPDEVWRCRPGILGQRLASGAETAAHEASEHRRCTVDRFKFPSTNTRSVLTVAEIPAHTMTLPP